MIITSKVPANFRNLSLIEYLSKRFTYLSHEEWLLRISESRVKINDIIADVNKIVVTDDVLSYDMPDFKEPEADLNYSIVYEDEWILAVNKPGNLLVHHQGRSFKSNLIYQLRYVHEPKYDDADIINRLDRETSGLVLVSKSKDALKKFTALFKNRSIKKEYVAIVNGMLEHETGVIDKPIGKDINSKIRSKQIVEGEKSKDAFTSFEVLERSNNYSLIKLYPKTGRTHQLRVHMLYLGYPIVGDKFYSVDEDTFFKWCKKKEDHERVFGLNRQALHCSALSFIHPFTNKELTITANIPDDMMMLINKKVSPDFKRDFK